MADTDPTPLRQSTAEPDVQINETRPTRTDAQPITDAEDRLRRVLATMMDRRIEGALSPLRDEIATLRQRVNDLERGQAPT